MTTGKASKIYGTRPLTIEPLAVKFSRGKRRTLRLEAKERRQGGASGKRTKKRPTGRRRVFYLVLYGRRRHVRGGVQAIIHPRGGRSVVRLRHQLLCTWTPTAYIGTNYVDIASNCCVHVGTNQLCNSRIVSTAALKSCNEVRRRFAEPDSAERNLR